jgi:uncharacterized membrane protein YebE (DUF533 family)
MRVCSASKTGAPVNHDHSSLIRTVASSPIAARPIHFRSFVGCRYPGMRTFLASLVALVMLSSRAYGEPKSSSLFPNAPIPQAAPLFGAVDWSLAGSVVIARALDWTSTEECLRRPWCREVELPTVLVKNKVGFGAFEAVASGFSILAQYEMTRHGHKRLARLGQSIDLGAIGYSVLHNYRRDGTRW